MYFVTYDMSTPPFIAIQAPRKLHQLRSWTASEIWKAQARGVRIQLQKNRELHRKRPFLWSHALHGHTAHTHTR